MPLPNSFLSVIPCSAKRSVNIRFLQCFQPNVKFPLRKRGTVHLMHTAMSMTHPTPALWVHRKVQGKVFPFCKWEENAITQADAFSFSSINTPAKLLQLWKYQALWFAGANHPLQDRFEDARCPGSCSQNKRYSAFDGDPT